MFDLDRMQKPLAIHILNIGTDDTKPLYRPNDSEIYFPFDGRPETGVKPFVRISFLLTTPAPNTIGLLGGAKIRHAGAMQVDVIGDGNNGTGEVNKIVSSVISAYKKGLSLGIARISNSATVTPVPEPNGDYRIGLTIPFSYVI